MDRHVQSVEKLVSSEEAHDIELDGRCLSTEYHEAVAIPSSPTVLTHLFSAPSRHICDNVHQYIHGESHEDHSGSPLSSSLTAKSSCSLPRSPSPHGPALSDDSSSSHSWKSRAVPSNNTGMQLLNPESLSRKSLETPLSLEQQRNLAICIKNLPLGSSDSSLKVGLYHEYKRYGKVTYVKVVGQGCDRYALVSFTNTKDVKRVLQVSHDKYFFGSKIKVSAYQGHMWNVDNNESRPIETDVDGYHSKATRTLLIGKLNINTTAADIRKTFKTFGEIIKIDIIDDGATEINAFIEYIDISSVIKAMCTMNGEFLEKRRISLDFGKSLATKCVWIEGVAESVSERYLNSHFNQFGSVTDSVIDRSREYAMVFFQQVVHAQLAVTQMRGSIMKGRKLQVDFASIECQQSFYEHLDKNCSDPSLKFSS